MRWIGPAVILGVALTVGCGTSPAGRGSDAAFALEGGERVAFFGDSITEGGLYITYLEGYLLTRFPDREFSLINHGVSSETISGTSEPDPLSRHPDALPRFSRDIAEWHPDVVVSCFGMNDGNYMPFDVERFNRFQKGVRTLVRRTRQETHAQSVVLTPPPFDPYRRVVRDPNAAQYGYRFPAVDYDETLDRYSRWLLSLRGEGVVVADVHTATTEHLRRRRQERVSFFLAADAVHPNETGHWLMTQTLLAAWHAPAACAEAKVDARALKTAAGEVSDLKSTESGIAFTWRTGLPMPFDPDWDPRSIELENVADRWSRYRLIVTNLSARRYRLLARLADDKEEIGVADFTREQYAEGVNLSTLRRFPTVVLGQEVLARLKKYRKAQYDRWRGTLEASDEESARRDAAQKDADELKEIRRLCQPRSIAIRLFAIETQGSKQAGPNPSIVSPAGLAVDGVVRGRPAGNGDARVGRALWRFERACRFDDALKGLGHLGVARELEPAGDLLPFLRQ